MAAHDIACPGTQLYTQGFTEGIAVDKAYNNIRTYLSVDDFHPKIIYVITWYQMGAKTSDKCNMKCNEKVCKQDMYATL